MNFKKHSDVEGRHAFLGASNYHWLRYSEEKLVESYSRLKAKEIGTELHAFAAQCIKLNQKLPASKKTINMYVNDAIGYKMEVEQPLYYSENCFGTADAICFRDNFLRIHDFKSGVVTASMEQLMIYAALFCLEYAVDPNKIGIELRIYQNNDILVSNPEANEIREITDKIIKFDKIIEQIKDKGE